MLLVQSTGEMAVLLAVNEISLHNNALHIWTDCNVLSTLVPCPLSKKSLG
jgi:hypothetical protein